MFCRENRIPRELYWVGFGFQIWCQLLTHILRAENHSILVVDEPEIYLHPDLQRQLVRLLRNAGPDILLATHSTEIVNEADPSEVTIIEKGQASGKRIKDVDGIQSALDFIGSGLNVTITQLARTRRVLFVEGAEDFKLLRKFAERLGLLELATGFDITPVPTGGFGQWKKLDGLAWGIEKTLGCPMVLGAVFDHDYFCDDEVADICTELKGCLRVAFIHKRKELENYLLIPDSLDRAIARAIADRTRRTGVQIKEPLPARKLLERVTGEVEDATKANYFGKYVDYMQRVKPRVDTTTLSGMAMKIFQDQWCSLDSRLAIVPGKEIFSRLNDVLRTEYTISLNPIAVIKATRADEVPTDLIDTLRGLDAFRRISK